MTKRAFVDVDESPDEAFGLADDLESFGGSRHVHRKHQLLYAALGTAVLTVGERRWMLPPQRAAWIRAGIEHVVESSTGIALRTVYFSATMVPDGVFDCRVFAVVPLAREMILHAMRWGPSSATPCPPGEDSESTSGHDSTREAFFRALAGLAVEWMRSEMPFHLPLAKSEELERAMRYVAANLADANVQDAAAAARVSLRTLTRRFEIEARMTFRAYLQKARMMRAMELLAEPNASVTTTAYAVGFRSLGAFTTAFQEVCGEKPSEYRGRVTW